MFCYVLVINVVCVDVGLVRMVVWAWALMTASIVCLAFGCLRRTRGGAHAAASIHAARAKQQHAPLDRRRVKLAAPRLDARPLDRQPEAVAARLDGAVDVLLVALFVCVCVRELVTRGFLCVLAATPPSRRRRRAISTTPHTHTHRSQVLGTLSVMLYLPLKRLMPIGRRLKGSLLLTKLLQLESASPEFCHIEIATPLWKTSSKG